MVIIFAATIFLGSFLLFFLEPLVGKLLLPFFGGAPAIWNTCLVFFQVALLLGYLLSAYLIKLKRLSHQIFLLVAIMALPLALDTFSKFTLMNLGSAETPLSSLLLWLIEAVLLVFIALSVIPSMVQKWFSFTQSKKISPYQLYAASNAGSLCGLLAYPLIFERSFGLKEQTQIWQILYLGLIGLILLTAVGALTKSFRMRGESLNSSAETEVPLDSALNLSSTQILRWITLSGLPSALLLGATNFILTDLVSLPLLWIAPLLIYLLTYIIAFIWPTNSWHIKLQIPASFLSILAICTFYMDVSTPLWPLVTLHLMVLALLCQICHAKLSALAPSTKFLGSFYVSISFGGALGGIIIQFIAPLLFDRAVEYPLIIALILLTFASSLEIRKALLRPLNYLVATPLLLILVGNQFLPPQILFILGYGGAALILYSLSRRPGAYAVGFITFVLTAIWIPSPLGSLVESRRNFYGITRTVVADNGRAHAIVHGSTIHGVQMLGSRNECIPTSYYHHTSPIGDYFNVYNKNTPTSSPSDLNTNKIAVVGLGVGSLICYARPSDSWTFYEINPDMRDVALDANLFTFLKNSPTPNYDVKIGDGRINLQKSLDKFDLIILDAFSSDAIPVHLLTLEGIETYKQKLTNSGAMLFHLSSRYFDLAPIVSTAGKILEMDTYMSSDPELTEQEASEGKRQSLWLGLLPKEAKPETFLQAGFKKADANSEILWTDDYSDPLKSLF